MSKTENLKSNASSLDEQASFFNQKMSVYRKPTSLLVILAGIINLLLLIPDLALIGSTSSKIGIIIIRVVFSIALFFLSYKFLHVTNFKPFSIVVTISEALGTTIFLFVFCQYSHPDILIQSLGLITLFLVIFLIPNRWLNMLLVALFGAFGFLICALLFVKLENTEDFMAGFSYVLIALLLCAIAAKNSEKHQLQEHMAKNELEHISTTDFLTKTANRFKIKEEAEKWITFCRRQDMPLSIVFADIDNMKAINDQYGHAAGDFVLMSFASLIQKQLRASDTLARWGGDEFVFLLPNTSFSNAQSLTGRIETCISEFTFIEGYKVSCSFGVIEMQDDSDFISMVNEADMLMYDTKRRDKSNTKFIC